MHALQPKHSKISETESEKLLSDLNISKNQLPKINAEDPALPNDIKIGDIVKIERKTEKNSETYYRVVI